MAIYMCPRCYKIYKSSGLRVLNDHDGIPHYSCPSITCNHFCTDLIELDDPIAKYISQLNILGYHTKACCSGHNYDNYLNIYILFAQEYRFNYLPENWEYENWEYDRIDKKGIRYKISEKDIFSKDIIIAQAMNSLDKWIKQLKKDNMEDIAKYI